MKTVTLWLAFNPNNLDGGYSWHLKKIHDGWDNIYSDPYEVEIPDEYYISVSASGEDRFFKDGSDRGYELSIVNRYKDNSSPHLIGGDPLETVTLKILRKIEES